MFLLAQVDPQLSVLDRIFDHYGIGGAIIFALMWFLFRHVPRIVEAHVNFVNASAEQSRKSVEVQAEQADAILSLGKHVPGISRATNAMRHGCELLNVFARGHQLEAEIKEHVRAIREALEEKP